MQAGRLNKRVTIQSPATGQDELGQPVVGWTDVATVWGSVTDISGKEYIAAGAIQSAVLTKITVRYRNGVAAAMRVLHGADTYGIEAVLRPYRDQMTLMCKRLAA